MFDENSSDVPPKLPFDAVEGISVHEGFPNPATDTSLQALDINKLLVRHQVSTYYMRIDGSDWQEQGIFCGDLAIIDRALKPRHNDLVVWWEGESFNISPRHQVPLDVSIWGIVIHTIHSFRQESV
jgi:hypothetical protein